MVTIIAGPFAVAVTRQLPPGWQFRGQLIRGRDLSPDALAQVLEITQRPAESFAHRPVAKWDPEVRMKLGLVAGASTKVVDLHLKTMQHGLAMFGKPGNGTEQSEETLTLG